MPLTNEFDEQLRNIVAKNIPCVHLPAQLLAEKALRTFSIYLEEAKSRGINTIDEVLEDMKIKNGNAE